MSKAQAPCEVLAQSHIYEDDEKLCFNVDEDEGLKNVNSVSATVKNAEIVTGVERCEEIQLIPNNKPQSGNKAAINFKKLNNLNNFADDRPNFASPDGKVLIQLS